MTLEEIIKKDLVTAMKEKDKKKLDVIRMVKAAIDLEHINTKKEITDELVLGVLNKQIKMRNDSIKEFEKANRLDLVEQNKEELAILMQYMPEQLTEEEITKIIDEAFMKINPTSSKDMGKIMKEITPKLKGKADMQMVSTEIKTRLDNNC